MAVWLLSLAAALVAICAGMAWMGFRGRINTVGIDLGTTFSVVGINDNGKIIIIPDEDGHVIFPSIVSYQENGEVLAGYSALSQLSKRPKNTIYNAKRFIGRSLEEEDVKVYASQHPYDVISHVNASFSNHSKVAFSLPSSNNSPNRLISPEAVGAEVLKMLLRITRAYMGHSMVTKAVIAVPAKFDTNQRQATGAAYKLAGLKVIRVIEEPTAAAVAYQLHKKSSVQHVLVYDFGGGTLDVSLLYIAKGSVQVYATDGDESLGGSDIDVCLYQGLRKKVEQLLDHPIDDDDGDGDGGERCGGAVLRSKAESAKKALTYADSVVVECTDPASGRRLSMTLNRYDDLEHGCVHLFDRALLPVTRLLDGLGMHKEEIDEIVLVGGSTRIPRVKQILKEYFSKELNDHIDPDVTVAYGAASILQ